MLDPGLNHLIPATMVSADDTTTGYLAADMLEDYLNGTVHNASVPSNSSHGDGHQHGDGSHADDIVSPIVLTVKIIIMSAIIFQAILGNCLVIISVLKFPKLRYISNVFIVSLATADLTVAVFVMPFNALQEIAHTWLFPQLVCDIYNANDVLFSTASLLHLCCISIDRFIAITKPLDYTQRMTKRRAAAMLVTAWGLATVLSHIPVHMGWYTTPAHRYIWQNDGLCLFTDINIYYALISSSTSFWIPATIMVTMYAIVFKIAREQEAKIVAQTKMLQIGSTSPRQEINSNNVANGSGYKSEQRRLSNERKALKRENKAAKTLGILMTVFLICWLPFFIWYVTTNICGDACPELPETVMFCMFWLGYLNSALNPLVYAMHNKMLRNSFYILLRCSQTHTFCHDTCCRLCLTRGWMTSSHQDDVTSEDVALKTLNRKVSVYSQGQGEGARKASVTSGRESGSSSPGVGEGGALKTTVFCKYDTVPETDEFDSFET